MAATSTDVEHKTMDEVKQKPAPQVDVNAAASSSSSTNLDSTKSSASKTSPRSRLPGSIVTASPKQADRPLPTMALVTEPEVTQPIVPFSEAKTVAPIVQTWVEESPKTEKATVEVPVSAPVKVLSMMTPDHKSSAAPLVSSKPASRSTSRQSVRSRHSGTEFTLEKRSTSRYVVSCIHSCHDV